MAAEPYAACTYPVVVTVRVNWPERPMVTPLVDAIKGLTVAHALRRAEDNWPAAQVEFLGVGDLTETG